MNPLPTQTLRELLEAAERLNSYQRRPMCLVEEFRDKADPTTIASLLRELLAVRQANEKLGCWLSAAIDDTDACEEFKQCIQAWFDVQPAEAP